MQIQSCQVRIGYVNHTIFYDLHVDYLKIARSVLISSCQVSRITTPVKYGFNKDTDDEK